jgi:hypothetical protein
LSSFNCFGCCARCASGGYWGEIPLPGIDEVFAAVPSRSGAANTNDARFDAVLAQLAKYGADIKPRPLFGRMGWKADIIGSL